MTSRGKRTTRRRRSAGPESSAQAPSLDQLPGRIWTVDRDLVVTSVQGISLAHPRPVSSQVLGRTIGANLGNEHPDFPPIAAHRRAIAGERAEYVTEWRGRTYQAQLGPLRDADGQIVGAIGIALDVTDAHRRESSLREALSLLAATLEATADGILVVNREGRVTAYNSRFIEMWRVPPEVIAAQDEAGILQVKLAQLKDPSDFLTRLRELRHHPENEAHDVLELQDGRILERYSRPQWIGENVVGRVVSFRDVTSRHRAEAALREAENRLRAMVESEPECVKLVDRQGRLLEMNPAGLAMIEARSFDEVRGTEVAALVAPGHREAYAALTRQVLSGRRGKLEFELISLRGSRRWMDTHASPLRGSDGEVTAVLSVTRDITERRAAEQAVARTSEQLRDLARSLQFAREEERATIAREIHDELGQSLTAIKMEAGWLRARLADGGGALLDKAREMEELITTSLDTVRRVAAELRPSMLDDLGLTAALEWQAEEFERRSGVTCTVRIADDLPEIPREQATVLFRILQEALTNVARHAEATAVSVTLTPGGDSTVQLEVADNGIGLTASAGSTPSLGILGMRERAAAYHGEVRIVGPPGKGTTVTAVIPMSPAGSEAP